MRSLKTLPLTNHAQYYVADELSNASEASRGYHYEWLVVSLSSFHRAIYCFLTCTEQTSNFGVFLKNISDTGL